MNPSEIIVGWQHCQGWCSQQKALTLASIIYSTRPKISVEIGIFGGKSLIPVAMAHRQVGVGKAIGIDPWLATESMVGQVNPVDAKWWSSQRMHDDIKRGFMEAREHFSLNSMIDVYHCPSNDFDPPSGIGLLSIDGNHGDQSITDVERFAPQVSPGGFVVMDDLQWTGGSVEKAVAILIEIGFRELFRVTEQNQWAVFQRI